MMRIHHEGTIFRGRGIKVTSGAIRMASSSPDGRFSYGIGHVLEPNLTLTFRFFRKSIQELEGEVGAFDAQDPSSRQRMFNHIIRTRWTEAH